MMEGSDHVTFTKNATDNFRKKILCDGFFYDVTDFIKKHPGGNVIAYYTENCEDSTSAIQQFHNRSIEKVRLMMSGLKKRPATDSESDKINEIVEGVRKNLLLSNLQFP